MIANVEGRLSAVEKDAIVVQIGGIGFRVHVPKGLLAQCGPGGGTSVGSTLSLYTHLHVREDELTLYGCATDDELRLFELLLGVSGIGPKVGLALLSTLSADEVRVAIASEQADVLSRVPGIGKKTAQRIILDLRDKVQVPGDVALSQPGAASEMLAEDEDVIGALTMLGYSVVEAQAALQRVPVDVRGVEERLRAALAYFGA
jgi:Holliday junction DNA helicase RuvA